MFLKAMNIEIRPSVTAFGFGLMLNIGNIGIRKGRCVQSSKVLHDYKVASNKLVKQETLMCNMKR